MSTVYFTASSLDGFIVDDDGSLDWLLSRDIDADRPPGGYTDFIDSVGSLAMGASTYRWLRDQEESWPYSLPTWILTHHPEILRAGDPVQAFSADVAALHPQLVAAANGKDVWIMGGGATAAQFVDRGLVDEMVISYAPCSLGSGERVLPTRSEWELLEVDRNRDFVVARWRRR
ncbi:dihydrofolate reductase family protein [Gordonia jinhuaensis]|uniref:Dihydrofolate reductase n=1 Tax=Gordonia jinhuaensis TaxID=1517702 RepID=A0A916T757_9ACTN|nr:dihydrofolate reductase family protein [Gordonia jinhuaensis]GGB34227.1 dihydrofolate reductase [Gordonia jinhuaensis]